MQWQQTTCFCHDISVTPVKPIDKLKRTHILGFYRSGFLILYGGKKGSHVYNDNFRLDTRANTWDCNWRWSEQPSRDEGILYSYGDDLFLFGPNHESPLLKFTNILSPYAWNSTTHRSMFSNSTSLRRSGCSYTVGSNQRDVFVFCGLNTKDQPTNLVNVFFRTTDAILYSEEYILPIPPRYNHNSCRINDLAYIFGGRDETSVFNDMYTYHSVTLEFQKVEASGLLPPPLYGFSMTSICNRYIIVYGGIDSKGEPRNELYRFDTEQNKWHVLACSTSVHRCLKNNAFHTAVEAESGVYMLGGVSHDQFTETALLLKSMDDKGVNNQLFHHFSSLLEDEGTADIFFKCGDSYIPAHRLILAARCSSFRSLVERYSIQEQYSTKQVIFLPFVDVDTLHIIIAFIYGGSLSIESDLLRKAIDCSKEFGLFALFDKFKDPENIHLDCTYRYVVRYKNDLRAIYDSISSQFQLKGKRSKSMLMNMTDLTLRVPDVVSDNSSFREIRVHKLIMIRSPYYEKLLTSVEWEDSNTSEIVITDISFPAMKCIIQYLYLDEISIEDESVIIEIYTGAKQLDLEGLLPKCREILSEKIDIHSVLVIIHLSDLYHDESLFTTCMHFIERSHVSDMYRDDMIRMLANIESSETFLALSEEIQVKLRHTVKSSLKKRLY